MSETIGQQLKQAREAKNLTIQKVVQATHIRAYQIEAMEADDFESLASPVQARAFLRLYGEFLGLSFAAIIARQRAGIGDDSLTPVTQAPVLDKQAASHVETETGSASVEISPVGGKLEGLISRIKGFVFSLKVPPITMEPVDQQDEASLMMEPAEESDLLEPFETESEEPATPAEEVPVPAPEALRSQAIFSAIGKTLRQRRESLSMTLDEIERHTHVRKHYLQALESGEFDRPPSSVQARGMLNNYAHFLDLDLDALLLTFAEALQTQRLERQSTLDESSRKPASKSPFKASRSFKIRIPAIIQRYLSVDIFVGGGLVVVLLIFGFWGTSRILNMRAGSTPQPTAPSILNILISTQEEAATSPTPIATGNGSSTVAPNAGETLVLTLPATDHGPVQVVLIAREQAWVRVTVDGKLQFEGRVTAGTAYSYDGNTQIEVLTGNGRAISILYNQNNLGPMGNFGEVVDHIYTANAILNPTATFTRTPTITQAPTATLRPTLTLRPSITPRPSTTPRSSPTPGQ